MTFSWQIIQHYHCCYDWGGSYLKEWPTLQLRWAFLHLNPLRCSSNRSLRGKRESLHAHPNRINYYHVYTKEKKHCFVLKMFWRSLFSYFFPLCLIQRQKLCRCKNLYNDAWYFSHSNGLKPIHFQNESLGLVKEHTF